MKNKYPQVHEMKKYLTKKEAKLIKRAIDNHENAAILYLNECFKRLGYPSFAYVPKQAVTDFNYHLERYISNKGESEKTNKYKIDRVCKQIKRKSI